MEWIEPIQMFFQVILPKTILEVLDIVNSLMSDTIGWVLLIVFLVSVYFVYKQSIRERWLLEHADQLDEILLHSAQAVTLDVANSNLFELGLWLGGEYVAIYQIKGETYVLLSSDIDMDDKNSPAAASLHIRKSDYKVFHKSGNFDVSAYRTINEKYLIQIYANDRIKLEKYHGVIESFFARYNEIKNDDENHMELQLAQTSKKLFETVNSAHFGNDGYMRYLLSMIKKVMEAKTISLHSDENTVIELGASEEQCHKKVFFIHNTNYRVEIGTSHILDAKALATVGSFLDLTGLFISTLSEESVIAKNYVTFLVQANALLEEHDEYNRFHSEKVHIVSMELGKALFLNQGELDALMHASRLHDIGSVANLDELMNEDINNSDRHKLHPLIGAILLEPVANIYPITSVIKYHHERVDGKGYPFGIKGNEIPKLAQILGLAEYFIGLISNRPFKKAESYDNAFLLVNQSSGKMFDKVIVDTFDTIAQKVEKRLIQFEKRAEIRAEH